jgi:hypothetical protein
MPRTKKTKEEVIVAADVETAPVETAPVETAPVETVPVETVNAVKVVCNKRGREIERVYTREVHGERFMELANEWAGKIGGTLIKE